ANMFGIADSARVVFTENTTAALNLALFGVLRAGDHCLASSMEHNSILRPLHVLQQRGVEVTIVAGDADGQLSPEDIRREIRPNTKLVAITHASNVTGRIMPVAEIGKITSEAEIPLLVDAAQTAGVFDIDVNKMGIDLLAVAGHKSLLGPTGTGALYIREGLKVVPLLYGGTGSFSEMMEMPDIMPDRYESGTINGVGIAGLQAGLDYIATRGMAKIRRHELSLLNRLVDGMNSISNVKMYGGIGERAPVLAFNIGEVGSTEVAYILDSAFNIATRAGLHCAPLAHKTIGTLKQGVVRVSLGPFNTDTEIDALLTAVEQIAVEGA
ncbi:MAG: aminotransferase class V-fold PLP-dependent enzyme, partial [bacterium]|nr:aminotransferase class V-fold PLP-dependent enzyme [bacterium]